MRHLPFVTVLVWLFWCGAPLAQPAVPASAPASAPATPPAGPGGDEAVVSLLNRPIAVFRAPFFGIAPAERARRTQRMLTELLDRGGPGQVTVQQDPLGSVLLIDGTFAMVLTEQDVDAVRRETLPGITAAAERSLAQVISETRESRDRGRLLRAVAWSALATLAFGLAAWIVWRLRGRVAARAARLLATRAAGVRVAGAPLVALPRLRAVTHWAFGVVSWLLLALFSYQWLVFVLTQFPVTRAWGERLGHFLVGVAAQLGHGMLRAVPDLIVAALIFLIAKLIVDALGPIFDRVAQGGSATRWLDRDTVGPTRRIVAVAIWLFAGVMAYPYLPGSDSDAFKGVSVLVGVMITLGGSSLIGQGASGLILMYSRTLRVGEYVRISDQEGTVTELGAFTTKIRTGLGEEVTVPNAVVLGTTTKNYSRAVKGRGWVLDTTVTIGYDTPWRQVQSLLLAAASRTDGILADPEPRVFQTALSDFYVEYRLVTQAVPELPRPRAEVLSVLHAHVLDVFAEAGVQIMSPHYLGDPADAKVPPPAR
ncbi:mechanosensitive ion channel family protein [Piscinibacter gummiphilus]|uniref:mechanosensitive ion channel family protein n=1 Tax=Piscinibacter gummiphilus TaxID=946333 RepID=UPI000A26C6D9|nr:mechanosensitive ion channel family protein [Piscinibacter gummiphilus]ATU66591.1 mechanosensitive ion channel family protein [Piscinibacter gummiphilus]GLS93964.1 mechanosensitive ion channel protein MscS [Piscinibacter gummiphilus]